MCPRFTPDCVMLTNSGNGRLKSKRVTLAAEYRFVPLSGAMPANGLATRPLQYASFPPEVISHCFAKSQPGRLRFMLPEYAVVRFPTYERSITEFFASRYWKPAENWCARGIL